MASRGFTLLELLVALVLISLIFLLLTSGLDFGTRAWRQEQSNGTSDVATVQYLVRRVLSEARPVMVKGTRTVHRHVFFDGSRNSIRFIAPLPAHLGVGGFYEVALYLTEDGGPNNRLEMSWRLFRSQSQERRVALLDKVDDIRFAYFGRRRPRDAPTWSDDWQGIQWLPELIRIHVSSSDGEHIWPDLTVATHVRSLNLIMDPFSFSEALDDRHALIGNRN